jgi:cell division protein FtsW (lipid II flippase)
MSEDKLPNYGAAISSGLCLLFLWYASGLSWWWLVGIVVLGALVQSVVEAYRLYRCARELSDMSVDVERRYREARQQAAEREWSILRPKDRLN